MKRKEWMYLSVFILILIGFFPFLFSLTETLHGSDWRNNDVPVYVLIGKIVVEDTSLPMWNPYLMGGEPGLLNIGFPFLYPIAILLSLFFNPYAVLNLLMISHLALAGISMFFLMRKLVSPEAGLVSGIIYMLSFYMIRNVGHPFWVYGIAFIPLVMFFALKTGETKSKAWACGLGLVLALHFLSGGVFQWYFTIFLVALYFAFVFFKDKEKKRIFLLGVLLLIVMVAGIGIRFLPFNEWVDGTNRGQGISPDEIYSAGHVSLDNAMDTFVVSFAEEGKYVERKYAQIGIAGLLLALFGVWRYAKKKEERDMYRTFLLAAIVLVIVFASGIFLDLLYHLPGVKSMRGLDRSLVIYVFAMACFAGYGMHALLKKVSKKKLVFCIVTALVLGNLLYLGFERTHGFGERFEDYRIVEENPVFLKMAEDTSVHRFHVQEIRGVDYNNFMGSTIPLEQESLYGIFAPVWDTRYFHEFLGTSFRSPAKVWGLFNVKYLLSSQPLNTTEYRLVENFTDVQGDTISKQAYTDEAYLYENTYWIPRAFQPGKNILVVGENTKEVAYLFMTLPEFIPGKVGITQRTSLERMNAQELAAYDHIILTSNFAGNFPTQATRALTTYVDQGGKIMPNILEGENSMDIETVRILLSEVQKNSSYTTIPYLTYYDENVNKVTLNVTNVHGRIYLSEKYTLYEGWTARADGNEVPLETAFGIMTTIHIPEGTEKVVFSYTPPGTKMGISLLVLLLVGLCAWAGYTVINRKHDTSEDTTTHENHPSTQSSSPHQNHEEDNE